MQARYPCSVHDGMRSGLVMNRFHPYSRRWLATRRCRGRISTTWAVARTSTGSWTNSQRGPYRGSNPAFVKCALKRCERWRNASPHSVSGTPHSASRSPGRSPVRNWNGVYVNRHSTPPRFRAVEYRLERPRHFWDGARSTAFRNVPGRQWPLEVDIRHDSGHRSPGIHPLASNCCWRACRWTMPVR